MENEIGNWGYVVVFRGYGGCGLTEKHNSVASEALLVQAWLLQIVHGRTVACVRHM